MSLSDRVAVLRKGEYIGTVETKETSPSELTDMMVGKKVVLDIGREEPKDVTERLRIDHLNVVDKDGKRALDDVSFTINGG